MQRMRLSQNPPLASKKTNPLRFGLLGAARIAPAALIVPAKSHSDVVVTAVACRDQTRGARYAKTHDIPHIYSGASAYQDLVEDNNIDAVYVALPNALHFEWTMRAILSGKHVLVEKPIADSADEARQIFALAEKKSVIVLEAIHFTFHPATHRVKEIIESEELGKVKSIVGAFAVPSLLSPLFFLKDDIRYSYDLGGGCTMDMGVYPLAAIRFLTGNDSEAANIAITRAEANGVGSDKDRVDRSMHTYYTFPASVSGETYVDFSMPGWGPFGLLPHAPKLSVVIKLEGGEIELYNYPLAGSYHSIKVTPRSGRARTEKVYKYKDGTGEDWWSTYRYQLEAFVDKVKGRVPKYWTDPKTTISQLECIEKTYEKAGMPARISSSYKPPGSDPSET